MILVCLALILRPSSMKVLSLITFIIRVFLHWSYCSPCSSRAQKCIIVTNRHHLEKWGRLESELLEILEISEIFEFSIKWYWYYGYQWWDRSKVSRSDVRLVLMKLELMLFAVGMNFHICPGLRPRRSQTWSGLRTRLISYPIISPNLLQKFNDKFIKKKHWCGLSQSFVCRNWRGRCPCRRLGHILWIFGSYPTRRRFNFIRIFAFSNFFKWSNRTGIYKPGQVHRLTVFLSGKS